MDAHELMSDEFETEVLAAKVPVLVDFWSPACGPCRMMQPVINELASESQGRYEVRKVNVWEHPELANRYQISAVPTLLVFKHGDVVWSVQGVQDKRKLREALHAVA